MPLPATLLPVLTEPVTGPEDHIKEEKLRARWAAPEPFEPLLCH